MPLNDLLVHTRLSLGQEHVRSMLGHLENLFSFGEEESLKKSPLLLVDVDSLALVSEFCCGIRRAVVTPNARKGTEYSGGER